MKSQNRFNIIICGLISCCCWMSVSWGWSQEVEIVNPRFKFDVHGNPIRKKLLEISSVQGWTASAIIPMRVILEVNNLEDPNPDKNSISLNHDQSIQQTLSHNIDAGYLYLFYVEARWYGPMEETEGEMVLSFYYIDENEVEKEIVTKTMPIKPTVKKDFNVAFSTDMTKPYIGRPLGIKIYCPKAWVNVLATSVEKKKE